MGLPGAVRSPVPPAKPPQVALLLFPDGCHELGLPPEEVHCQTVGDTHDEHRNIESHQRAEDPERSVVDDADSRHRHDVGRLMYT